METLKRGKFLTLVREQRVLLVRLIDSLDIDL